MKKILAVTLAIVFVLAFAAPVFAQSMTHNATYKVDGTIDLEKQVGHLCNTGAEMKQTITGEGELDKVMDTAQVAGVLTVNDKNDFVTAEDAVRNLTVTSVIELCAPAKHTYDRYDWIFGEDTYEMTEKELSLFEFMFYAYEQGLTAEQIWEDHIVPSEWTSEGAHADIDIASKMSFEDFEEYYDAIEDFLARGPVIGQFEVTPGEFIDVYDPEWPDHSGLINPAAVAAWHAAEGLLPYVPGHEDIDWPYGDLYTTITEETGVAGAGWTLFDTSDGVLYPATGYPLNWEDSQSFVEYAVGRAVAAGNGNLVADILAAANYNEVYDLLVAAGIENVPTTWTEWEVEALTDQIWAVQVSADPGFSGNLHQDFEAAYGPWEGHERVVGTGDPAAHLASDEVDVDSRAFGFRIDEDGYVVVERGDDYVGNYFNIDQMARTSMGTVRRYIDVSSPWSGAYLYEDMEVVGMSEIEETFAMSNLAPGEEAVPDWWDLF